MLDSEFERFRIPLRLFGRGGSPDKLDILTLCIFQLFTLSKSENIKILAFKNVKSQNYVTVTSLFCPAST